MNFTDFMNCIKNLDITQLIIFSLIVILFILYVQLYMQLHNSYENMTTTSNEAIQNVSSMYNQSTMTAKNILATGSLTIGATKIASDGTITVGPTTIQPDGTVYIDKSLIINNGRFAVYGKESGDIMQIRQDITNTGKSKMLFFNGSGNLGCN